MPFSGGFGASQGEQKAIAQSVNQLTITDWPFQVTAPDYGGALHYIRPIRPSAIAPFPEQPLRL